MSRWPGWVALGGLVLGGCRAVGEGGAHDPTDRAPGERPLSYLLEVPDGEPPEAGWPLLLFLHGIGERGEDLSLVAVHGPPRLIGEIEELSRFVLVAPQCPDGAWWEPGSLMATLDEVCEKVAVDPDRICVTGLSMGGFGTWKLLASYPDHFAAALVICGGGDASGHWSEAEPGFDLEGLVAARDVAIRAYHGEDDDVVAVEEARVLVEALQAVGAEVELTVYPGVGHDSWTQTYAQPQLYTWLLEQRRERP